MTDGRNNRCARRWYIAIIVLLAIPGQAALAQTAGIVTAEGLIKRLTGFAAVGLDLNIQFGVNNAAVTPRAKDQMRELGNALASRELAAAEFEIIGHTDASGGAKANQAEFKFVDFTGADLTGVNFNFTELDEVIWSGTVCPDGVMSQQSNPETCCGHTELESVLGWETPKSGCE